MGGKRAKKRNNRKQQDEREGEEEQRNDSSNNNIKSYSHLQAGDDAMVGRVGGVLRQEMSGVGGAADGIGLMEGWSGNQLELFHALVRMVSKVGDEGAAEMERRHLDGAAFVSEITALRARARKADEYEVEMATKKTASEDGTVASPQEKRERPLTKETFDKSFEEYLEEKRASLTSSGVQTDPMGAGDGERRGDDNYTALTNKYSVLKQNNRELSFARQALENRLREKTRNEKGWVDYARALEKQRANLVALLNNHGISTEGLLGSLDPPKALFTVASTSPKMSPSKSTGVEMEIMNDKQSKSSFRMLGAPEGNENVLMREITSPRESYQRLRVPQSEQWLEEPSGENMDVPVVNKLWGHLKASDGKTDASNPITLPKEMHGGGTSKNCREDLQASQIHHSSSTQADWDANSMIGHVEQEPVAPILVKLESPSNTPVVISSRSVRKRKRRNEMELDDTVKVKVEVISSSPIGLAGLQNLFPQENMDLDDIGEKVDTPKKKRQLARTQSSHIDRFTGQFDSAPKGMALVLQPVSPNKQILSRSSGKERQRKQRRLVNGIMGASIFAEDTDNESTNWDSNGTKDPKYRVRSSTDIYEVEQRLTGLLEEPSPQRTLLTPKTALDASVINDRRIAGFMSRQEPFAMAERRTVSILRQSGAPATPNQQSLSRNITGSNNKTISHGKPALRTPRDIPVFDPNSSAYIPLRKRNLGDLELSHFKINPNSNHGYDYAFSDIVRGREQRKCLSGCTKPECCGNKLRKFVEMISGSDEQQTESQEQEDERLLEEYLGDNRYRLRTMTKPERNELLIQAKTRDLAQKAGKHRHAYERRRSPPGFWRTDFPSTQELQADRNEAARVQRELVQQRYDEAMRPGGKWIFRDE